MPSTKSKKPATADTVNGLQDDDRLGGTLVNDIKSNGVLEPIRGVRQGEAAERGPAMMDASDHA